MMDLTNDQVGASTDELLAGEIPKETLVARINEEHHKARGASRAAVDHARKAGELLNRAKADTGHGAWRKWLKANFEGSARTATDYMSIASGWKQIESKSAETADLTIAKALSLLRERKEGPKDPKDPLAPLRRALSKVPEDAKVDDVLSEISEAVYERFGVHVRWSREDEMHRDEQPTAAAEPAKPPSQRSPSDPVLDLRSPNYPFWARLYQADALEILDSIERPDLIVTDPPYGKGTGQHRKHGAMAGDDDQRVGYAVLAKAIRKLKPGGMIYCFSDPRVPFDLAATGLVKQLYPIAWHKAGGLGQGDCRLPFGRDWEYVAVGIRLPDMDDPEDLAIVAEHKRLRAELLDPGRALPPGPEYDDAREELRTGFADRKPKRWRPRLPMKLRRSAMRSHRRVPAHRHSTEKPVALLQELIGASSQQCDLVLDPFAGSGSTGEACLRAGRRFVGIELKDSYASGAAMRLLRAAEGGPVEAFAEEARWWDKKIGHDYMSKLVPD